MGKTKTPNVDIGETARTLSFNSCGNERDVSLPTIEEQPTLPSSDSKEMQSKSEYIRDDIRRGVESPIQSPVSATV